MHVRLSQKIGQKFTRDRVTAIVLVLLAGTLNYVFLVRGSLGGFSHFALQDPDEMFYASCARNLVRGEGLVEQCVHSKALLEGARLPQPYRQGSLFPLLVAFFQSRFSSSDLWAVMPVWLCYALLIGCVYCFARMLFPADGSVFASLFVAINPLVAELSVKVLPDLPTTLALTVLLWALMENVRPFLLGLLWGVCYCINPTFLFYLPVVPYVWRESRAGQTRLSTWGPFLGGGLSIFWPWILRNLVTVGKPFLFSSPLFTHTTDFHGTSAATSPAFFASIGHVFSELAGSGRSPATWVLVFGFLGSVLLLRRDRFRNTMGLTIVCGLASLLLTHAQAGNVAPLTVPLLFCTFQLAQFDFGDHRWRKRLARAVSLVVIATYLVLSFWGMDRLCGSAGGQYLLAPEHIDSLTSHSLPDQVVASDASCAVAWQCDRPSVLLPEADWDLLVMKSSQPIDFIFVKDVERNRSLHDYAQQPWFTERYQLIKQFEPPVSGRLYRLRGSRIAGYPYSQLAHVGNVLYLFKDDQILAVEGETPKDSNVSRCPPGVVRVKGDPKTGGFHLLTEEGLILGIAGATSPPVTPSLDGIAIDFAVTPSDQGCYLLLEDGRVVSLGDALPIQPWRSIMGPLRIELSPSGQGYFVLERNGSVVTAGDALTGIARNMTSADLALAPQGRGYYILDPFGATHPSDESLPLSLGRYSMERNWACDIEILEDGSVYVLSDIGELLHYTVK